MQKFGFSIVKQLGNGLGRAGVINTPNGKVETPAFIAVGTAASVKSLSPEQVREAGAQAVLSNTYHLYLRPGSEIVKKAGGLSKFMNWNGPTFTDSGGFQVFSLGAAFGKGISKFKKKEHIRSAELSVLVAPAPARAQVDTEHAALASIDEDGVTFRSHIDGTEHRLTPEKSMEIQHDLGADIIFAFDECTSPDESKEYQREAMDRTHRWAARSLARHKELGGEQALMGIVQGGRYQDLRIESAQTLARMEFARTDGQGGFDGFGIGGSFNKEDIEATMATTIRELPEGKMRHLLGIGEPEDMFVGVENGADTFDCVVPTRLGRNGTIYTKKGKIILFNSEFVGDFTPLEEGCGCYTCKNFTKAYLSHLFRAREMLAGTLGSIHNLHFLVGLVANMRKAILAGNFAEYKKEFIKTYEV